MLLEPHKLLYRVFFGEAVDEALLVFPNPSREIGRHPDIKRAVSVTRKQVYVVCLLHVDKTPLGPRFRGDDKT